MKLVKVTNNIPDAEISINQNEDGSFSILLKENNKRALGSIKPGDTVKLGNREFIVLNHCVGATAVITKEFAKKMKFGKNGNYKESDIRKYCNGEFYNELVDAVGKNNILPHTVNLIADDGTGEGKICTDNVSILTTENYRRYRKFFKAIW